MTFYDNCGLYIEEKKSLKDKILAYDQVLTALNTVLLKAATGEDVLEYSLNDGQTVIKQTNRGIQAITKSIMALKALRQDEINRYQGRVFRAHDSKNFRNRYGGQF